VKAAGCFVVVVIEFTAGVQHRKNHFERAFLTRRMLVDWYSAPIVLNGDRGPIFVEGDPDIRRMTVHCLVNRVVEDFPHQMMQTRAANATDVHARAAADGVEPFQNGNVFRCVSHERCSYTRDMCSRFGRIVPNEEDKYEPGGYDDCTLPYGEL
jgi:hypothetical protein